MPMIHTLRAENGGCRQRATAAKLRHGQNQRLGSEPTSQKKLYVVPREYVTSFLLLAIATLENHGALQLNAVAAAGRDSRYQFQILLFRLQLMFWCPS